MSHPPTSGGETRFPLLDNLTVAPKRGRAILWANVLDESPNEKDDRTDHEALPVLEGVKYGANAWFHQRDYQASSAKGCTESTGRFSFVGAISLKTA